ncbi:hypothetical protein ACI2SD_005509, partial [Escherichia coli]
MRNDISSTDTLYLGIASKPQNLGVTLTTQTTGSFRNFMVELQICNSPINHRRISAFGHSLIICVNISNHNDHSASAILSFALISVSYRRNR